MFSTCLAPTGLVIKNAFSILLHGILMEVCLLKIIHMEDGGVSFQGSLEEMQSRFAHLVENVDEVAPQE